MSANYATTEKKGKKKNSSICAASSTLPGELFRKYQKNVTKCFRCASETPKQKKGDSCRGLLLSSRAAGNTDEDQTLYRKHSTLVKLCWIVK